MSRVGMIVVAVLVVLPLAPAAAEGTFPSRTMKIIVPFAPGGSTDQVARLLAGEFERRTGQPAIVDNRPGGGAQIAARALMEAPADGHTLFVGDIGAFSINPSLYANLSFDPERDFEPVSLLMSSPMVLLASQKVAANDVRALLEDAKRAGRLTYGSQGIGTGGHLLGEVFKSATGASLLHVPYKGGAPALQALVAGEVDLVFFVMGVAHRQAQGGKAKILAVAGPQRSKMAPDTPTLAELGYPEVEMTVWFGLVTRKGTPRDVVQKLNGLVRAALAEPRIAKLLNQQGYEPAPTTPGDFASLIRNESAKWGKVVKSIGVRVE